MNKWRKIIIVFLAVIAIAGFVFAFVLADRYVVPIIMYHSVSDSDKYISNIVSPEMFTWHMEFLSENGYTVISLDELVEAILNKKKLPFKSVVITFDDGYEDNYTYAFPVLKKYGFPATIFTATVTIDTEGYLTPQQIDEMHAYGVAIGSHGLTQGYLPELPEKEQRRQIINSKEILERKLNQPINYISYPTGGFSEKIKDIVRTAGYKGACTTNRGYDSYGKDIFELKRIRFGSKDNSSWILRAKLSGFYNLFRSAKAPY